MAEMLRVIPAQENDLPAIRKLLEELIEATEYNEEFNIEAAMQNYHVLMKNPNSYMLVAKDSDDTMGFINFTTRQSVLHQGPSGLIDELVVSEKSRGSGIGKKLITAAIQKCRELKCSEVEVSTEKSNTKARRFYKSCGFEEDAVLLEFHLEQAPTKIGF